MGPLCSFPSPKSKTESFRNRTEDSDDGDGLDGTDQTDHDYHLLFLPLPRSRPRQKETLPDPYASGSFSIHLQNPSLVTDLPPPCLRLRGKKGRVPERTAETPFIGMKIFLKGSNRLPSSRQGPGTGGTGGVGSCRFKKPRDPYSPRWFKTRTLSKSRVGEEVCVCHCMRRTDPCSTDEARGTTADAWTSVSTTTPRSSSG